MSLVSTRTGTTGYAAGDVYIGVQFLIGTAFTDTLSFPYTTLFRSGGAGDDVLDGGAGVDQLLGGVGNDTYYVDVGGDMICETGNQRDTVIIGTTSYTLASGVENGTAALTSNTTITGSLDNNTLTGN